MLHLYAFGKLAEVARPPASTVIMQLTEHQDFQMMPVRGEFIDNSSVLAEQEKTYSAAEVFTLAKRRAMRRTCDGGCKGIGHSLWHREIAGRHKPRP